MTRSLVLCLFAAAVLAAPASAAAEVRNDVYHGATCIPDPAFDSSGAIPYTDWLYGFEQGASCHFTMPDGWRVQDLSYVIVSGTVSAATPMRVRLCVYAIVGGAPTCGAEGTLSPGERFNLVAPPGSMSASASGAYLDVSFPTGVSVIQRFVPVWSR